MIITKVYNFDLEEQKIKEFLIDNNNLIDSQNINETIKQSLFRMSGGVLQNIKLIEYPFFIDLVINSNGLIEQKTKQVQTYYLSKNTLIGLKNIFLHQIILSPPIVNCNDYKEYRHISIRFTK